MKKVFSNVLKFKSYILYQTSAELKSELSGSYLGFLWLILEPLAFMLIYTFIAGVVFKSSVEYFPIFIFSGLIFWNFFANTLKRSTKLVKSYSEIISKIFVPKYIFLIVAMLVNLYKLGITFFLLIIFMLFYQVPITFNIFFIIPIIITVAILTFGFSTFFMHYGVIITDLVNVTNILLKFMFYLSGIFYSLSSTISGFYGKLLETVNPIAFIITSFRECFLYGNSVDVKFLFIWFLIGCFLSVSGLRLIVKHENSYVKVMK